MITSFFDYKYCFVNLRIFTPLRNALWKFEILLKISLFFYWSNFLIFIFFFHNSNLNTNSIYVESFIYNMSIFFFIRVRQYTIYYNHILWRCAGGIFFLLAYHSSKNDCIMLLDAATGSNRTLCFSYSLVLYYCRRNMTLSLLR